MTLRIVQLTDLHLTTRWGDARWLSLEQLLSELPARAGTVDRLVLTGDLAASGKPEVYRALRQLLLPWLDKLLVLPGNHDNRTAVREVFVDRMIAGARHASFCEDLSEVRLLGLDTSRPWRVSGKLGPEQLAWLAAALDTTRPSLIFMHHPPLAVGTWWLDKDILRDRKAFLTLVGHGNVRAVFCGHVHQSFEGKLDDIPVWTTPSTAYQFLPGSLLPRTTATAAGFRVIEFSNDTLRSFVLRYP